MSRTINLDPHFDWRQGTGIENYNGLLVSVDFHCPQCNYHQAYATYSSCGDKCRKCGFHDEPLSDFTKDFTLICRYVSTKAYYAKLIPDTILSKFIRLCINYEYNVIFDYIEKNSKIIIEEFEELFLRG